VREREGEREGERDRQECFKGDSEKGKRKEGETRVFEGGQREREREYEKREKNIGGHYIGRKV
jgi:hypothetical protein